MSIERRFLLVKLRRLLYGQRAFWGTTCAAEPDAHAPWNLVVLV